MKGILITVFLFLCGLLFIVLKAKDQAGNVKQANTVSGGSQQTAKRVASQKQSLKPQSFSQPLAKVSFASDPIPPEKVNKSQYDHFFEDAVIREGRIFRWHKPHLNYYIDLTASRKLSKSKVRRVFRFWTKKTRNLFTFSEVSNPKLADIHIKVAEASEKNRMGEAGPDVSYKKGSFKLGGLTVAEYEIHHAQVTISIDHFDHEQMAKYSQANADHGFQTLVHELGHVLGIMGHSPKQEDCMYYRADARAIACDVLTPEVNTLAMIYGKPNHLTRGFFQQRRSH